MRIVGPNEPEGERQIRIDSPPQKSVEFASALGQFLFVLPARVDRGLKNASSQKKEAPAQEALPSGNGGVGAAARD